MKIPRKSLVTLAVFFVLLTGCTAAGYWLIFRVGKASPIMFAVGVAAILTCLLTRRDLAGLGWNWGSWKYQWMSYLLPLLMTFLAYCLIWAAGFGSWYDAGFAQQLTREYTLAGWDQTAVILFHFLLTASHGFALLLPAVLGEELGWRGFLVPELAKFMSFSGVAVVSGIIWSVWHWPIIFMGLYGSEGPSLYYQLFFFTLLITSLGVIMAYLRFKTNSLWTAVIFHTSWNVFIQKVFDPLTLENARSAWFVNEFGAVPAVVAGIFAVYFWRKGKLEFGDQSKRN